MEKQLAEMLADCLDWIEKEGGTPRQAVDRFPDHRDELLALIGTIHQVTENTTVVPSTEFQAAAVERMKNRLRARKFTADSKQGVTLARPSRLKHRNAQKTEIRRFSMSWLIVLITTASLLLGGGGVAYASTDSLPGDSLYGVKTMMQDVELALSGDEGDIDLLVDFLNENIDELNQLADKGRWEDLEEGLEQYQGNLDALKQTRLRVSYLDAPSEDALNNRLQQELHTQSEDLKKLQIKLHTQEKLQNKIQEAIQQTEQGKIYGPSDGGKPDEPGSPNGVGPGEPQGMQDQQGNQSGEGQEQQGNQNGQSVENGESAGPCRLNEEDVVYDENGEVLYGEGGEDLPVCGEQSDPQGNNGQGNGSGSGQGGKP